MGVIKQEKKRGIISAENGKRRRVHGTDERKKIEIKTHKITGKQVNWEETVPLENGTVQNQWNKITLIDWLTIKSDALVSLFLSPTINIC